MSKLKKNYLLDRIPDVLKNEPRGKLLDLGCGWGMYAKELHDQGFQVTAADFNPENFRHHDAIEFQACNLTEALPFADDAFDYLIFIETIEHLEKPFEVIGELSRVLKPGGKLILSTPNILNVRSRMRFLTEGCFDFFREPPIELQAHYIGTIENIHIIPWRYHELEYLLSRQGFYVEGVHTDFIDNGMKPLYFLLYPFLQWQRRSKERRSLKKGGMDFRRINNILFMDEILFGKHLILKAVNTKKKSPAFGHYEQADVRMFDPKAGV